MAVAPRRSSRL